MVSIVKKIYKKTLTIEFSSCSDCPMRTFYDYGVKTKCFVTKDDITNIKTIKRNCPLFKEEVK